MCSPSERLPSANRDAPDRARGRMAWPALLLGFVALLWFLIRVLPKPSRASYPCQRAAFPLASSFVLWVSGVVATTFALRFLRREYARARRRCLATLLVLGLAGGAWFSIGMPARGQPRGRLSSAAPNSPLGTARGIYPGRVVWAHDPNATNWSGPGSGERWWAEAHTNSPVVERLFTQSIQCLAGRATPAESWDRLFRHFNVTCGRGDVGYTAGEKIAVKLNLVTCILINPETTYEKIPAHQDRIDPAPQLIRALLRHLVNTVGVAQGDITLGDPTSLAPEYYFTLLHAEFPNVHWVDNRGGVSPAGMRRERATFSSAPMRWSTADAAGKTADYLPACFAAADYLINLAVLKGHSCGITACGKNLYGSLIRTPDGNLWGEALDYYDLHLSLPNPNWSPGTGHYRALVDLMGHPELGGKTFLYLIDGLYAGYYWDATPKKWASSPFGEGGSPDWPSSLFVSQDPVAIDSVAHDFLLAEWPRVVTGGDGAAGALQGGEDDYLHEAATAPNPPSGTFYDSAGAGTRMASLGVHEHWNNPTDKKYTRNLGAGPGIELLAVGNNHPPLIDSPAWAEDDPVMLPAGTTVHVVASDLDNDILTYGWNMVSGPAAPTFANPAAADSGVTFHAAGDYTLRVIVRDGLGGEAASNLTVTVNPLPGDLNRDNVVNAIDLQIVIVNFGKATGDPGCDARADSNGDGVVNALDLHVVIAHFGTAVPQGDKR